MTDRERIETMARERAGALGTGDFATNRVVLIRHRDGTQFAFRFAFLASHESWRVVFTEHNGFHCFHEEVLEEAAEFVRDDRVMAL